ncbi:family 43 glycosylhydrolase [Pedobacter terrae]|uniref:family 43 glycosylhydrolase n=1 Tax=Pedobacter terrae TaxID=405671 RepID=UPI002FF64573
MNKIYLSYSKILISLVCTCGLFQTCEMSVAQGVKSIAATKKLNPLLPGYFADPTIKKFGNTYYIYSTTDNIMLASGAPTVWYSTDFENWYNYTMDVPSFTSIPLVNFWAPDVVERNGKYYLYFGNCEIGCNIYGYVSDTPVGPWKKLSNLDKPVITHNFPKIGFPSLDAQFYTDNDNKIYGYWGTWVHYNGGYAVGELNSKTMSDMQLSKNIPLIQTPQPFEAPYMIKKGKKYILMYSGGSCHDDTYNVRYSYADTPYGPFTPGKNNPILSTNGDNTVHGPGHHSVLQDGNDYYIVYHKHDYPMTRGGLSRQVCIDKLVFENDSTLKKVEPEHTGLISLKKQELPENIALNMGVTASSFYCLNKYGGSYNYQPSFATDGNNATLWKAGSNMFPQDLTIDLGREKRVKRVFTQFEFPTFYYQYILKYSIDGRNWRVFADKSANRTPGSPMIDDNDVKARYVKLIVVGSEKQGLYAAVWNMKIFDSLFEIPLSLQGKVSLKVPAVNIRKGMILNLDIGKTSPNKSFTTLKNKGTLGGLFKGVGDVRVQNDELGVKAINFVNGYIISDRPVPQQMAWNGSYSIATWVKNPVIDKSGECLMSWCNRKIFGLANSYNAMYYSDSGYGAAGHLDYHFDMKFNLLPKANEWHHLVLTFDGIVEKIFVDGRLDNQQNMTLSSAIDNAHFIIGSSDEKENYTGLIASLKMYDYALSYAEILKQFRQTVFK